MNDVPESVVAALRADVPPSYVLDMWAIEEAGADPAAWAELRGVDRQCMQSHAGMARREQPAYTGGRGDA